MEALSVVGAILFALLGGLNVARAFIKLLIGKGLCSIVTLLQGILYIAIAVAITKVIIENNKVENV